MFGTSSLPVDNSLSAGFVTTASTDEQRRAD